MKQRKHTLGELATQFFAYVQLRKKETVSTDELVRALRLSSEQERDLLRRLDRSGSIVRLRRGLYLITQQIPVGGRWSPGEHVALAKLMEDRETQYQICAPSAFYFHGLDNQAPQITCAYNNPISEDRGVGNLRFFLIKVSEVRLGGATTLELLEGATVRYNSTDRTIMDAVYYWSHLNGLPRGYEWIRA